MNSATTRMMISIMAATAVSLLLFYFMSQLINQGQDMKKSSDNENFIEFVRIKRPTNTELKKRELPKKPEVKQNETPKEMLKVAAQDVKPNRPTEMKFDTPKLDIPLAAGAGGMAVNGGGNGMAGASSDSDEVPLIRVEPQFPPEAAMKGITTGYVRMSFDLNPDGSVTNARIVNSSPRDVFDNAAIKAVVKWKYRPKMVDGKAVKRIGLKIQLDFGQE